jgi:hypothetical protein
MGPGIGRASKPRSVGAYAAEGIGTLLLVFFICGILSVGNAHVLQLDLAGLGMRREGYAAMASCPGRCSYSIGLSMPKLECLRRFRLPDALLPPKALSLPEKPRTCPQNSSPRKLGRAPSAKRLRRGRRGAFTLAGAEG